MQRLVKADGLFYGSAMTSTAIIEEIKRLPPTEQVEVIRFASELARKRQLTATELGELADRSVAEQR